MHTYVCMYMYMYILHLVIFHSRVYQHIRPIKVQIVYLFIILELIDREILS